jgi:hypothetical protein
MNTEPDNHQETTHWPYASLFFFGYFGKNSPGGRTLYIRSTIGTLLCALGIILSPIFESPFFFIPALTLVPVSVLIIMWAYKEYLSELDELSKMIQYEAFAFAYGMAMAIGLTLYAAGFTFDTVYPAVFILFAEFLRGLALTRIAKKYS